MSIFDLVVILAVLGVSFCAASRIFIRTGYSIKWLLVPLVSLVLTVIGYIKLYVDLHSLAFPISIGFSFSSLISGVTGVGIVWGIDRFTILANWILFLILAFSPWPVALIADSARRGPALPLPPVGAAQYGRNAPSPLQSSSGSFPPPPATMPRSSPSSGDSVGEGAPNAPTARPTPAPSAGTVRTKHCVWCGESLPGSRALFHDCGSKDRPVTNCARCGATLPSEGAACVACTPG